MYISCCHWQGTVHERKFNVCDAESELYVMELFNDYKMVIDHPIVKSYLGLEIVLALASCPF